MNRNGMHPRRPSDEERAFFDAIVALRAGYAARGVEDARPVIGLHHAMSSANRAMRDASTQHLGQLGT